MVQMVTVSREETKERTTNTGRRINSLRSGSENMHVHPAEEEPNFFDSMNVNREEGEISLDEEDERAQVIGPVREMANLD